MSGQLDDMLATLAEEGDGVLRGIRKQDMGTDVADAMRNSGIACVASEHGWETLRRDSPFFKACTDRLGKHEPADLDEIDWGDVLLAQDLFGRYGNEIGSALLLAALPQTYATQRGSRVLVGAGGLTTDLTRRVRGTAQFLMLVLLATKAENVETYESCNAFEQSESERQDAVRAAWLDEGVRWRVCSTLRVYHETIRRMSAKMSPDEGVALNQEDLLGALLTFSITVFEVLEQFGISWTDAEKRAYLRTWNLIGSCLGIQGLPDALEGSSYTDPIHRGLPHTVADAQRVLAVIRARNWPPLSSYANLGKILEETQCGSELLAALVHELTAELPGPLQRLPEIVIRQLAQPVVRDRLGLGDGGLPEAIVAISPRRGAGGGRLSAIAELPRRARAAWLRQAANTVSRAATVHFINGSPEFIIPGLMEWVDGWRDPKKSRRAPPATRHLDLSLLRLDPGEPSRPTSQLKS